MNTMGFLVTMFTLTSGMGFRTSFFAYAYH
jgi:hypothetical protein